MDRKQGIHEVIGIPDLLVGGTEIQTLNLARVLVSAGYRVTICCYYEYDVGMVRQFKAVGAEVLLMKYERVAGPWHLAKGLIRLFKEKKPDIVHVQYLAPGLIPIIAAKLSGMRRVFATVHQPGRPYGLKAKLLIRLGAYLSTAFFCVSKSAEESWFGNSEAFNPQHINYKRKHFTIYNAVAAPAVTQDVDSLDGINLKESIGLKGHIVIGIVGRLRNEKGHSVLLSAMTNVIEAIPDVMLLVVGDGPDRKLLEKRAACLGIAEKVIWMGSKEPSEVFKLYSIMDVVVVPSLFEGFGLSAAEAMAAGKPVIASDVDGLREIVEDGVSGYLVPVGDSNAMAKCLIELLTDALKAQKLGLSGKKKVGQQFSLERFSQFILSAYRHFSPCG